MEFSALFLAVTVVMVVAWWGTRTLALALFAATRSWPPSQPICTTPATC